MRACARRPVRSTRRNSGVMRINQRSDERSKYRVRPSRRLRDGRSPTKCLARVSGSSAVRMTRQGQCGWHRQIGSRDGKENAVVGAMQELLANEAISTLAMAIATRQDLRKRRRGSGAVRMVVLQGRMQRKRNSRQQERRKTNRQPSEHRKASAGTANTLFRHRRQKHGFFQESDHQARALHPLRRRITQPIRIVKCASGSRT